MDVHFIWHVVVEQNKNRKRKNLSYTVVNGGYTSIIQLLTIEALDMMWLDMVWYRLGQ